MGVDLLDDLFVTSRYNLAGSYSSGRVIVHGNMASETFSHGDGIANRMLGANVI